MKTELLLLFKKHTDKLIGQTKTKAQKTLNLNLYLAEDRKWLLAVTSFEATISVFKTNDENISFPIGTPG